MPTILEALHLCLIIPRNLLDSCSSFKIHPGAREGVQEEEDIWVSSTEHFLSPRSHQGLYTVCTLYQISWNNSPKRRRKGKGNVGGREKRYTVSHLQQQHFYSLFTMILLESFVTCQGIKLWVALEGLCVSIMCSCVCYLYQLLRDIWAVRDTRCYRS